MRMCGARYEFAGVFCYCVLFYLCRDKLKVWVRPSQLMVKVDRRDRDAARGLVLLAPGLRPKWDSIFLYDQVLAVQTEM